MSELIQSLERYNQSFHGMSFETNTTLDGFDVNVHDVPSTTWVSSDGNVIKCEGLDTGKPFGTLGSRFDRWCFRASVNKEGRTGMTVTFYENGSSALASISPHAGFVEHLTLPEYARESVTSVKRQEMDGVSYWALHCDHPQSATITFLFDEARLLKYIIRLIETGDKARLGMRLVEPFVAPSGVRTVIVRGPIEYVEFESRLLPKRIPFNESGKAPGVSEDEFGSGAIICSNYVLLDDEVSSRIEFKNLKLPDSSDVQDGKVTSQGEWHIRYEVHDGKLVKITDTSAVNAANSARMSPANGRWYGIMGAIFLIAVTMLVWHRRRNQ